MLTVELESFYGAVSAEITANTSAMAKITQDERGEGEGEAGRGNNCKALRFSSMAATSQKWQRTHTKKKQYTPIVTA